jgi:hypothetical protein
MPKTLKSKCHAYDGCYFSPSQYNYPQVSTLHLFQAFSVQLKPEGKYIKGHELVPKKLKYLGKDLSVKIQEKKYRKSCVFYVVHAEML